MKDGPQIARHIKQSRMYAAYAETLKIPDLWQLFKLSHDDRAAESHAKTLKSNKAAGVALPSVKVTRFLKGMTQEEIA